VTGETGKEGTTMAENTVNQGNLPVRGEDERMPATRDRSRYLSPAVDIYEDAGDLVVIADVPGLKKDDLDISVENDVLTIRGRMERGARGNLLSQEYALYDYFRQFTLGEKIDRTKIEATLEQGVLSLRLPAAEEAKPRRIEVKAR
jgi:HSP20 family protein